LDVFRLSALTVWSLLAISLFPWFCSFARAQECRLPADSFDFLPRGVKVCSHVVYFWTTLVKRQGEVCDQPASGGILQLVLPPLPRMVAESNAEANVFFAKADDLVKANSFVRLTAILPEATQPRSGVLPNLLLLALFLIQVNLCLICTFMFSQHNSVRHSEIAPCFCCRSRRPNQAKWEQIELFPTAPTSPTPKRRRRTEIIPKPEAANDVEPVVVADLDPKQPNSDNELLMQLIKIASRTKAITLKPHAATGIWGLAVSSVKGNVRTENQDCAVAFEIGAYQVLVIADGLGGLRHGGKAAGAAVKAAAFGIMLTLGSTTDSLINDIESVASEAVRAASQRLSVIGRRNDIKGDGLRTTLIVVVGNGQEIGYAYIGDGGGCIYRHDGRVSHFLQPQKADINTPNVLAASLGPVTQGCPVTGKIARLEGDLVVIGTDGVFDRLETSPDQFPAGTDRFIKDMVVGIAKHAGDLRAITGRVLLELTEMKDELGYIFNDNMTLGMMGTGIEPAIPNE